MKILSSSQIRELDQYTILHEPVSSIDLMKRASRAFTYAFVRRFSGSRKVKIFCGPGNNGGDGLTIARLLLKRGYKPEVFLISSTLSEDAKIQYDSLREENEDIITLLGKNSELPALQRQDIVIDALFGTGLSKPVTGLVEEVIRHINASSARVVSVDVPSGLYSDKANDKEDVIIKAELTFTFQLPKLSLFFCQNNVFTGHWKVLDIGLSEVFIEEAETKNFHITKSNVSAMLKPRTRCSHKGMYGHALIWSGSYGKIGAVLMASRACLRAGAGLLTVYLPGCGYNIMQTVLPEAMTLTDEQPDYLTTVPVLENYTAIGIGPGLGKESDTRVALAEVLQLCKKPIVIDADALNLIASEEIMKRYLPEGAILTPHPKEFDRMAGESKDDWERWQKAGDFALKYHCIVVLKSAFTSIHLPDGRCWFNTTGNPGMAKGGSGDVLTGILTSLLAQGYSAEEAAILGVYIHGRAGNKAAAKKGVYGMLATDLIEALPDAFRL